MYKGGKGVSSKRDIERRVRYSNELENDGIYRFLFKLAYCCSKVNFCDQDKSSPEFTQFSSQLVFCDDVGVNVCGHCVVCLFVCLFV